MQTQTQFEIMYGDKAKWSKTTLAAFEHLFGNVRRAVAANNNGVTVQTLSKFLATNKIKHYEMYEFREKAEKYFNAQGKPNDQS